MVLPPDQSQREQALDTRHSFIVQAPAGSGKTELLVQRYLALLSQSPVPEAVLAITFTRKAAAEMHCRVLNALKKIASFPHRVEPPIEVNSKISWQLARKLYIWQEQHHWDLLSHPNRLQIQTIDAFYATLNQKLPLQSGFGGVNVTETPESLYQTAIWRLLEKLETNSNISTSLERLLQHLDNHYPKIEQLLIPMLGCRDQWLPIIDAGAQTPQALKTILEQNLRQLRDRQQESLQLAFASSTTLSGKAWQKEMKTLLQFSWAVQERPPLSNLIDASFWQAVCEVFLTQKGDWRQRLTHRQGFPLAHHCKDPLKQAECRRMKSMASKLLEALCSEESIRAMLVEFQEGPAMVYTGSQWSILQALFQVLSALVTELRAVFQEQRQIDYIEMNLNALRALGDEDSPTDLLLALDYQIQHILVDEFQDTSLSQLRFLTRLTEGWEAQDGRTLFLVGDPMQSIYRFRKAEAKLFLEVKKLGIGNCTLRSLTLSSNFRSHSGLVQWINRHFSVITASFNKASLEPSLLFSPSQAIPSDLKEGDTTGVHLHWLEDADIDQEADAIVALTQKVLNKRAQKTMGANTEETPSVAILGRTRQHLKVIFNKLRLADIPCLGLDLENLSDNPVIQDLLALTRALIHLADETAWLAILRAPWCGLSLYDLHALKESCHLAGGHLIWDQLQCLETIPLLSPEGKARLARCLPSLQSAVATQGRLPLRHRVQIVWYALGGPACLPQPLVDSVINDVELFFEHLDQVQVHEDIVDGEQLEAALQRVYTHSSLEGKQVVLMTLHKAKGLEFDTVILPGLHRSARIDALPLILLEEPSLLQGLLIAPIAGQEVDATYRYLRRKDQSQAHAETVRLLYVGCSRAKKQLHLVASLKTDGEGQIQPPKTQNLLKVLWPSLKESEQLLVKSGHLPQQERSKNPHLQSAWLRRMTPESTYPKQGPSLAIPQEVTRVYPRRQDNSARAIGIVIHQLLQRLASEGLSETALYLQQAKILEEYQLVVKSLLLQAGANPLKLSPSTQRVMTALRQTLRDARGRWILSGSHQEAHAEYAITVVESGVDQQLIIDRSFIEKSTYWIIDYKTSEPNYKDIMAFFQEQQEQHGPQLMRYAQAIQKLHQGSNLGGFPIQLGLYWPLLGWWHSWRSNA